MAKVKSITVINGQGSLLIKSGVDGIVRIEDKSLEYEDSFYSMYMCYGEKDNLIKSIEGCPVLVDYYTT